MTDPVFDSLLLHTASVLRGTVTLDGYGGQTTTWSTVISTCVGLWQPTGLQQSLIAVAQWKTRTTYDIQDEDRMIYSGKTYLVKSVVNAAGMGHHLVCNIVELSA